MTVTTKLLVLDFDGTICLGDGPVYSYARRLDEALAARDPEHPAGLVETTLRRFLGEDVEADEMLVQALETVIGSPDGYAAAARLAHSRGITNAELSAAYQGSRDELATGSIPTWAPPGLPSFLQSLPDDVLRVLVTNAPEAGIVQQLAHLGLAGLFGELVTSAGKPAGMPTILERLRADHGVAADHLLSVGDIWMNDLEPAHRQGSATALIERLPAPEAVPDFRAPTFEDLYEPIGAWVNRS
ncbi:HAD family hydrolase [Frondihabitans cladoniiphilus]|uniref:HAD family hydrolase n=1 Tax=Frondihabitans cladoniiphilus TaxID=715785 RepID=A0ABP8W3S6_9MICO